MRKKKDLRDLREAIVCVQLAGGHKGMQMLGNSREASLKGL